METTTLPEDRSSARSSAWNEMSDAWEIMEAVWKGALSLRKEGSKYLLQFPREDNAPYQERKKWRSVFYDQTKRTLNGFAGLVFAENPAPSEAPKPILDLFSDIDLCGNDFNTFLLNAFKMFLRDGNGFFLATAPPLTEEQQLTKEEKGGLDGADRVNDRAYGVFFTAAQCINHRYGRINGRDVLTQITIEESSCEAKGEFGEQEVIRHRIFRRGSFEVRKFASKDDVLADKYETEDQSETGYEDITIVPIAEIGTEPPFLGIALLNILHYNKSSDFDNWCHQANVPQMVFQFDSEEDANKYLALVKKVQETSSTKAIIGFGQFFKTLFLEVSGSGAEITVNRIKDLEMMMAKLGLEKLAPVNDGAQKTATEVDSDNVHSQSEIAMLTRQFENAVEKFLYFLGVVENDIRPGTVNLSELEKGKLKLNISYEKLSFSLDEMEYVRNAVTDRLLSKETYLELLPAMLTILPDKWTKEIELQRLKDEEPVSPTLPDNLGLKE